jgi:hypothetical protein
MSHCTIAAKARRLMGLACDMGWVALARSVLPLVNACGPCAEDIVRQINATMAKVSSERAEAGQGLSLA